MFNFFKKRAVLVKYPDPMKVSDVQRIFREQGENDKIWQALDTILDNYLLDAVHDVSDPSNNSSKFAHAAGRVDAISAVKARIEECKK